MRRVSEAVFIILLIPLLLPLMALAVTLWFLHRMTLYLLVWLLWLPKGKDILFVYSDSPIWKEYMTQQLLPLVEQRAVVLNWSERSKWPKWSLAARVMRYIGGGSRVQSNGDSVPTAETRTNLSILVGIQRMEAWQDGRS